MPRELYYNLSEIKLIETGDENEDDGKFFKERPSDADLYGSGKDGRENT